MHGFILTLAALYGGIWWRFRGGGFTALTGFDPGTGGMRAIAAAAIALPLLLFGWWWALMFPALWCGWSLAGWGSYQGMGYAGEKIDTANESARLLMRNPGLRSDLEHLDFVGMMVEGLRCMFLPAAATAWATHSWWGLLVWAVGILFAPAYWIAQKRKPWWPRLGRFAQPGSEWGEVLVGAEVYAAIVAAALVL